MILKIFLIIYFFKIFNTNVILAVQSGCLLFKNNLFLLRNLELNLLFELFSIKYFISCGGKDNVVKLSFKLNVDFY